MPRHIAEMNAWASTFSPHDSSAGGYASPSIVDQDTVEQRAAQAGSWTQVAQLPLSQQQQNQQYQRQGAAGGIVWDDAIDTAVMAIMQGPVSPSESGITPHARLYNGVSNTVNGPHSQALHPPLQQSYGQQAQYNAFAAVQPAGFVPQAQALSAPAQGQVMGMPTMMAAFPTAPAYQPYQPQQQYQQYQQGMDGPPPYMQPPLPPLPPGGRHRKKRRFPIWARALVGVLLFLMLLGGGGYAYYLINFSSAVGNDTNQAAARLKGDDNPNQNLNGNILSGPRVNILLLGSDTDQKFGTTAGGSTVYLAQTDIIVSIDPTTKSVVMLSIPRDFYINIPGYGMGKLDEAFAHGYSYGQGGFLGGVALSRLTIYQDFGISINYYAWVGLDGFVKVIDTVGGVDVDVLHPITDDAYPDDVGNKTGDTYAYKRLYIPPGPQHLSGGDALDYVRSRHADLVGDFGRSARQQQVLSALKIKLANPNIIGQLPQLASDLNGWVKTDMQLPDVIKLMNFARTLDASTVQRVVLEPPYSSSTTLPSGESIVEPNCSAIVPEITKVLQLSTARCNIYASSNTTQIASSSPGARPVVNGSADIQQIAQASSQLASLNPLNLVGGSSDLFGIHSMLDLLFTVVFESPQAMQV
ncbi:MAG TPA: LCP family protein [Ktedonobacteraceae bacterium]|nr:LCP family protein [Ktedonobacteraceae bacterium]